MRGDENEPPSRPTPLGNSKRRLDMEDAVDPGPRKKPYHADPLVHFGRHFGRTIHAMCNIHVLLINGLYCSESGSEDEDDESDFTISPRDKKIYRALLRLVPGLEKRLAKASEEGLRHIADLLQRGVSSARSDDTKSLKGAVLDWITTPGVPLIPHLSKGAKSDRGFNHEATGALLCPADMDWKDLAVKAKLRASESWVTGEQWPILIYKNYEFDPANPWEGLLRSKILVSAYKYVFTSPSSVYSSESRATRSGNAQLHGMKSVTIPSLAYIATLVRFSLSSSSTFSKTCKATDSQRFYNSVIDFLEDPLEAAEVEALLEFWNWAIFPEFTASVATVPKTSALARLRERRETLRGRENE